MALGKELFSILAVKDLLSGRGKISVGGVSENIHNVGGFAHAVIDVNVHDGENTLIFLGVVSIHCCILHSEAVQFPNQVKMQLLRIQGLA